MGAGDDAGGKVNANKSMLRRDKSMGGGDADAKKSHKGALAKLKSIKTNDALGGGGGPNSASPRGLGAPKTTPDITSCVTGGELDEPRSLSASPRHDHRSGDPGALPVLEANKSMNAWRKSMNAGAGNAGRKSMNAGAGRKSMKGKKSTTGE